MTVATLYKTDFLMMIAFLKMDMRKAFDRAHKRQSAQIRHLGGEHANDLLDPAAIGSNLRGQAN